MTKIGLLSSLAVAGGIAVSAQAAVTLPSNQVQVTSDAVFSTSFQPKIDVNTGLLVDPGSLPVLTAYGEVLSGGISDANDSDNKGSVSGELTFKFTGTLEADAASLVPTSLTDTSVSYTIVSTIKNAEVTFYDDETPDFNVNALVGASAGDSRLANATDGDVFLHATADDDLRGTLEIEFFRVSSSAAFTSFKIKQQSLNNTGPLTVDGGSVLGQIDNVSLTGLNANQTGPFPPGGGNEAFTTETLNGVTVNANVDKLIRANSSAVIEGSNNNVIPEPASAMLLTLGGAMLLARRRTVA